jgi:hypothetical protein
VTKYSTRSGSTPPASLPIPAGTEERQGALGEAAPTYFVPVGGVRNRDLSGMTTGLRLGAGRAPPGPAAPAAREVPPSGPPPSRHDRLGPDLSGWSRPLPHVTSR